MFGYPILRYTYSKLLTMFWMGLDDYSTVAQIASILHASCHRSNECWDLPTTSTQVLLSVNWRLVLLGVGCWVMLPANSLNINSFNLSWLLPHAVSNLSTFLCGSYGSIQPLNSASDSRKYTSFTPSSKVSSFRLPFSSQISPHPINNFFLHVSTVLLICVPEDLRYVVIKFQFVNVSHIYVFGTSFPS